MVLVKSRIFSCRLCDHHVILFKYIPRFVKHTAEILAIHLNLFLELKN